jgi:hypothetical protein
MNARDEAIKALDAGLLQLPPSIRNNLAAVGIMMVTNGTAMCLANGMTPDQIKEAIDETVAIIVAKMEKA